MRSQRATYTFAFVNHFSIRFGRTLFRCVSRTNRFDKLEDNVYSIHTQARVHMGERKESQKKKGNEREEVEITHKRNV